MADNSAVTSNSSSAIGDIGTTAACRPGNRPTCPKCGSLSGQWRGYRETKKAFIHRRWCSCCNKWFSINLYQELVSNGQANGDEAREDQLWFDAFMEAYEDALSRGDAT